MGSQKHVEKKNEEYAKRIQKRTIGPGRYSTMGSQKHAKTRKNTKKRIINGTLGPNKPKNEKKTKTKT